MAAGVRPGLKAFFSEVTREVSAREPTRRELRRLGLVFLAGFGLLGGLLLWRGHPAGASLFGPAALFGLWGLLWPKGLRGVHRLWMGLAVLLGFVVSRLLLSLLYYLVLTPIGLVLRLWGKDLLELGGKEKDSYWHLRPDEDYNPGRTEKMY